MPQLDISTFTSQLFWLCVSFFSMLFIMSKFIIPKIGDILAQRQRKIDDYLHKAHMTRQQAEESLNKYHQALADATRKADETLRKTQEELNSFITGKQMNCATNYIAKLSKAKPKSPPARPKLW